MTDQISAATQRVHDAGPSKPRHGRDPVNQPMVNNWVEAIGDRNPVYTDATYAAASVHKGLVAPPAMLQAWTMNGLHGERAEDDPLGAMTEILDDAGFTSVVATNCEQTYHRYLRAGDELAVTTELVDVVGPKRTALGEGWFVTTKNVWRVGDEPVAEMTFRILKFRPPHQETVATEGIRPQINQDTEFFWEGTAAGELRVRRCLDCGALRHPPGPACLACGSYERDYQVLAGTGTIYSYVVHHNPKVPGRTPPFVIALVRADEGPRILGELLDVPPEEVEIGAKVRVDFQPGGSEWTLPVWRKVQA